MGAKGRKRIRRVRGKRKTARKLTGKHHVLAAKYGRR